MMSPLEVLTFVIAILAAVSLFMLLPKRGKISLITATFLTVVLTGFTQPASAAAVKDNVLNEGQKALNETLKTTPQGNQYQGIEYPQVTGTPLSDEEITQKILNEVPNDLKVSVSNGAVRVSGKVSDRSKAQNIVQDIKDIPGVHEVSYDLGLAS
jgi:osmotically-inducible protein OsmY